MTQFRVGDRVVCVDNESAGELTLGEPYTVQQWTLGGNNIQYVGLTEVDDGAVQYRAGRFIPGNFATALADDESQPPTGDAVLAYLMEEIEGYAEQPAEDEYNEGYKQAMVDMLADVYGLVGVTTVDFVQINEAA